MSDTNAKRRQFVQTFAFGSAMFTVPGLFAEELTRTPRQTEGPFYPDKLPLDTDNDLIRINDEVTPAVGTITHLTGRVLSETGEPVRNAVVEIWQADGNGVYIHSRSDGAGNRDGNFQGYGRFLTNSKGEYYFRTIKPVPYPGRTPHIHYAVSKGDQRMLTTQLYIQGEKQNDRDGVLRGVGDPKLRQLLMAEFKKMKESKIGELAANFDVIIGKTPEDREERRRPPGPGGPGGRPPRPRRDQNTPPRR